MSCEAVQRRLEEALAARREPAAGDHAHAEGCSACAAHRRFLVELTAELDALVVPPLAPAVLAATRERAAGALRERAAWRGFGRELAAAVALALVALPVAVAHGLLVARGASALLGAWVPAPVLSWLGLVYFGSVALAFGVLYGSLPLAVAFSRRMREEAA